LYSFGPFIAPKGLLVRVTVCGNCRSAAPRTPLTGVHSIIALGLVCYASPGGAQTLSLPANDLPPLALSFSATYDTNVARSSAAIAQARGILREDEIYSPAAQLNLSKSFGAGDVFLQGMLGYDFYQHNSILNRQDIDLSGGFIQQAGTCKIAAGGTYVSQQSDLQQLTVAVTKNTETSTSASLVLKCDRTSRLSAYFSVIPIWSENSATLQQTSNSRSIPVNAGIGYSVVGLGTFSVFAEYNSTTYPNRLVDLGSSAVTDGYQLYGGGLRWEREIGERFKVTIAISEIALRPRATDDVAFLGYEADATYQFTPRLEANVFATRAANPVNRLDTTYSVDQTYGATVGYRLGARTKLSVDGQVADHRYFGSQINPGIDLIAQSNHSVDAKLSYDLRSGYTIALTATQEHGTADIPDYRYNDSRAELSLSAAF
jgi:hypothetical protein